VPEPRRRLTPEERREKEEEAKRLRERRERELAGVTTPSYAPDAPRRAPGAAPPATVATRDPRKAAAESRAAKREEEKALRERRERELIKAKSLERARGVMHRDDPWSRAEAPPLSARLKELFGDEPIEPGRQRGPARRHKP